MHGFDTTEVDDIWFSITAVDKKGRVRGINPIVYKDYSSYGKVFYERLKNAVAVEKIYEDERLFCIIYKYGGMTYIHHKDITSSFRRYIFEEEVANPLREKYNYDSVKDFVENKNISDEEKIEFIRNMLHEYSEIFDKRGRWEDWEH